MKRWILLCLLGIVLPVSGAELTVATFNIRFASRGDLGTRAWNARKDLVVEAIRKMNPDVFGVQEALAHQVEFLAEKLPEFATIGVGRDDGKRAGEYSAIFYRKERLERDEEEGGTFWYSDTPDQAGTKGWGNEVIRICTWSRFTDRESGGSFYLFNTHWDHQNQPSREKAGRLLARRVEARVHRDEPVILTGDFNATETNPGIAYLLGRPVELAGGAGPERWEHPLRSTFLELHPDVEDRRTFNGWRGDRKGPFMIDHVLVSPHWRVKKAWIDYHQRDGVYPSDHYPVAAVLERIAPE